jgi:hypothetical protein
MPKYASWQHLSRLISTAITVRARTSKSLGRQLAEIQSLRRLGLGAGDYYTYCLFDDNRFTPAQKREYVGDRFEWEAYRAVNDPGLMARSGLAGWWGGQVDKLLFDCLMKQSSVPVPRILAIYDTSGISYGDIVVHRSIEDLGAFVRSCGTGFFGKPSRGDTGVGAIAVERVEGDYLVLPNGAQVRVERWLEDIAGYDRVIIQELLQPHPSLRALAGKTVATVRASVLRRPATSTVHRTILRIPVGTNMVDNFDGGRGGNMVAWVDVASGRIERVVAGTGIAQKIVDRHPDTGSAMQGAILPHWQEGIALLQRASRVLSAMPLQSWDLAMTTRGPVLIEINDVSSHDVLQAAGPPGLLDDELCTFLRELGFDWPYPHA